MEDFAPLVLGPSEGGGGVLSRGVRALAGGDGRGCRPPAPTRLSGRDGDKLGGRDGDWLASHKKSLQICFSGLPCLRSPSIGSNLGVDEIWLLRRSGCPAKMAHSDIGVVPQFKSLLQPLSISPDF